jgi:hypothetical protein
MNSTPPKFKDLPIQEKVAGVIIVFIAIGVVIWGVPSLFTSSPKEKKEVAEVPEQYSDVDSYLYAKGAIETILKAPATADFPWMGDVTRYKDNIIKVEAYVDAENSFGANLRSPWTVIFRDNEGRPELLQVVLDGQEYYRDPSL